MHKKEQTVKVSEPAVVYNSPNLQGLKNRLMISINETTDEEKLQHCLELLKADSMPGVFTEEEFAEVLSRSEASGNASTEDVKAFFAKWGH